MFRVENNVPDVYVQESRDFQLFSRLYDLVFQSTRYSIDSLKYSSDTMHCNDALLPLLSTKVGFFTELRLTDKAARQLLYVFPKIIKYKGSMKGIELVTNIFGRIMNTEVSATQDKTDLSTVVITFTEQTPDVSLLYSLLDYVRPTGMIINYEVKSVDNIILEYSVADSVDIRYIHGQNNVINNNDEEDKKNRYLSDINYVISTQNEVFDTTEKSASEEITNEQ